MEGVTTTQEVTEEELKARVEAFMAIDYRTMTEEEAEQGHADLEAYRTAVHDRRTRLAYKDVSTKPEDLLIQDAYAHHGMYLNRVRLERDRARRSAEASPRLYREAIEALVEPIEYILKAGRPSVRLATPKALTADELAGMMEGTVYTRRSNAAMNANSCRQRLRELKRQWSAVSNLEAEVAADPLAFLDSQIENMRELITFYDGEVASLNGELERREEQAKYDEQFDAVHLAETVRRLQEQLEAVEDKA